MRTHTLLCSVLVALLLAGMPAIAQDWEWMRHIGGTGVDIGRFMAEDEEGNVYVLVGYAGETQGNPFPIPHFDCYVDGDTVEGSADAFIAKYNPGGDLLWLQNCVSPAGSMGFADLAIDTTTQALFVVGSYVSSCALDTITLTAGNYAGAFLSRWDYNGNCVWATNVANSGTDLFGSSCYMRSVAISTSGQVVVSGSTTEYASTLVQGVEFPFGSFTAGYDPAGAALWAAPFLIHHQGPSVYPVQLASHGAFVYAHTAYSLNASTDTVTLDTTVLVGGPQSGYFLARLDPFSGALVWLTREGQNGNFLLEPLVSDGLGRPAVAGLFVDSVLFSTDTLISPNNTVWSSYIAVHDTTGAVLHARAFHSTGGVYIENLVCDPGGGFYATGHAWPGTGDWDGVPFEVTNVQEIFISRHAPDATCSGVFSDGGGPLNWVSMLATNNGLYVGIRFSWNDPNGTVTLGDSSFTTYGYQDALLAKLDRVTGITPFRGAEDNTLHIYANPNNGLCTIDLPQSLRATDDLVLSVYDNTGQLVQRVPLEFTNTGLKLDVRAQAKGIYHVELGDGKQRYTGTIVFE